MPDVQADIFHLALSCHLGARELAAGVSVPQHPFSEISRYRNILAGALYILQALNASYFACATE